jgi:hypothetical protein
MKRKNLNNLHIKQLVVTAVAVGRFKLLPADAIFVASKK